MDFSRLSQGEKDSFFQRTTWIPSQRFPTELTSKFADALPGYYQLIAEEDRLVVVSDEAALAFWKEWLKKE
jgi:hypothetical protein